MGHVDCLTFGGDFFGKWGVVLQDLRYIFVRGESEEFLMGRRSGTTLLVWKTLRLLVLAIPKMGFQPEHPNTLLGEISDRLRKAQF